MPNRYQSGRISKGVAKGLADMLIFKGSKIANPNMDDLIPKITMGNMYKISFGHPAVVQRYGNYYQIRIDNRS